MDEQILFWTKVGAIGQAVGALATAAAVIVSLWVVLSERAARVTVKAGLRMLVTGDRSGAEDVISIEVTNIGQRPIRVNSIGWRTGWLTLGPVWARQQYAMQTSSERRDSQDPPYLLEAGEKRSMFVDLAPFRSATGVERRRDFFGRKVPFFGLVTANIHCFANVVGARSQYFAVEKPLAKFLVTGAAGEGAEKFNAAARERRERRGSA